MTRKEKLKELLDSKFGGSQADLSRAISRSPAQIHQWLSGHRNIGDAGARHIEITLNLGQGWLDGAGMGSAKEVIRIASTAGSIWPFTAEQKNVFDRMPASEQRRITLQISRMIDDWASENPQQTPAKQA